jgi:hypothetical protein
MNEIVDVVHWFDDERTEPADYVVQLYPGLFEARCYDQFGCWSNYERAIGVFTNVQAACRAIGSHTFFARFSSGKPVDFTWF